jgi:hypothetical protein
MSTESYNDGQWHHYAATREGNIFSLYVDGVLVATETAAGVSLNDGTGLAIGNLTDTYAKRIVASGSLDELKIYTSALSAVQIEAAYNEYAGSTIVITETDGDTKVIEGYSTDSYMLSLAFEPTSDVFVTLSSDALDFGNGVGVDAVLTFTTSDWDIAQEVIVSTDDDDVDNGQQVVAITHAITSEDSLYDGRYGEPLNVIIIDDDGSCGDWGYKTADINFDCNVDYEDFYLLASGWLNCTEPTDADCILP